MKAKNPDPERGRGLSVVVDCLAARDYESPIELAAVPQDRGAPEAPFLHANFDAALSSQVIAVKGENRPADVDLTESPSYYVNRDVLPDALPRTAGKQGLTVPELRRLHEAGRFLHSRGWNVEHVTVAGHHLAPEVFRQALRQVKSRVADCQRRGGMTVRYHLEVIETQRSVHAHLIVAVNAKAKRLLRNLPSSPTFSALDDGANAFIDVRPVRDLDKALGYLSKEMSAWAYDFYQGRMMRRRVPARKGVRLGDRVRLSKDLDAAMLEAGSITPYKRSYAKAAKSTRAQDVVKHQSQIQRRASLTNLDHDKR